MGLIPRLIILLTLGVGYVKQAEDFKLSYQQLLNPMDVEVLRCVARVTMLTRHELQRLFWQASETSHNLPQISLYLAINATTVGLKVYEYYLLGVTRMPREWESKH